MLEAEKTFFDAQREKWIAAGREGQWVVVHDQELLGFFTDNATAFNAGASRWGSEPFLVRRITRVDEVQTLQRVAWVNGH